MNQAETNKPASEATEEAVELVEAEIAEPQAKEVGKLSQSTIV